MDNLLKKKYITSSDILVEPNDILITKSDEVTIPLSKEDTHLLKLLYHYVTNSQDEQYAEKYHVRPAVGLAAPQIGVLKQMVAIKTTDEDDKLHKLMLVNPTYTYKSDEMAYLQPGEGCLSVEEGKYKGFVPRHYEVHVEAYNLLTHRFEKIEAKGYFAIVLQHELDHLDGVLYMERINKLDPFYTHPDWRCI